MSEPVVLAALSSLLVGLWLVGRYRATPYHDGDLWCPACEEEEGETVTALRVRCGACGHEATLSPIHTAAEGMGYIRHWVRGDLEEVTDS